MQIWPAIDILGGQCVRLVQGDYGQKTIYGTSPGDMAARWVSDGAEYLHLVDLDGAKDGTSVNKTAISEILQAVKVPCQLGGGIREESTIVSFLEQGIQRLVIGTKAFKDPVWFEEMCRKYPDRLVVGIDAKNGQVATDGWLNVSDLDASQVVQRLAGLPVAGIVYTDISRDGMLAGPNVEAVARVAESTNIPVIASGGVTTADDVSKLAAIKVEGCVIGKSLYEGKLTLAQAQEAAQQTAT